MDIYIYIYTHLLVCMLYVCVGNRVICDSEYREERGSNRTTQKFYA